VPPHAAIRHMPCSDERQISHTEEFLHNERQNLGHLGAGRAIARLTRDSSFSNRTIARSGPARALFLALGYQPGESTL
jgi:hypothetical protein